MNIFQYLSQQDTWNNPMIILPLLAWLIFWKGNALLVASRKNQLTWFWIIMIANTLGILEILYLLFFSKTKEEISQMIKKCPIRNLFARSFSKPRVKKEIENQTENNEEKEN